MPKILLISLLVAMAAILQSTFRTLRVYASFVVADQTVDSSGGNWTRWNVPDAFEAVMARIASGDLFILRFHAGVSCRSARSGRHSDDAGLTAEGGVSLSDIDPLEVGGTVSMPGLSDEGGVSLSSVAALNVGGTATLPGLSAEGVAYHFPRLTIQHPAPLSTDSRI